MCLIDDKESSSLKLESSLVVVLILMSPELEQIKEDMDGPSIDEHTRIPLAFRRADNDSSPLYFPSSYEEDDDLTKSKIKSFLDEKVIVLKRLQTPLHEEFLNILNGSCSPSLLEGMHSSPTKFFKLPPRSRSPGQLPCGLPSAAVHCDDTASPTSYSMCLSHISNTSKQTPSDVAPPQHEEQRDLHVDGQQVSSPSLNFFERQKKWKEELDEELARQREMIRQSGVVGKASSSTDQALHRQKRAIKICISSQVIHPFHSISSPSRDGSCSDGLHFW